MQLSPRGHSPASSTTARSLPTDSNAEMCRCLARPRFLADTDPRYVIGIGSPAVRAKLDEQLTAWGRTAATLIHPAATVASDNRIGDGVLLAAGARVTTNVTLGRHVHLNVNAVVSHDCVVGDYTTLSPGALVNGDVPLGTEGVFLGTGAIITPGITIGDHAVIGAGAVVVTRCATGCDC